MKTLALPLLGALVALSGCYTMVPRELAEARTEYARSMATSARTVAPTDLYEARRLLDTAERALYNGDEMTTVRDLAYLALRKIELAESRARTDSDWREVLLARKAIENLRAAQTAAALNDAANARNELNAAKDKIEKDLAERDADLLAHREAERAAKEQAHEARLQADQTQRALDELNEKLSALQKVAPVKQEDRGTVITLSGSVLFASGKAALFPAAMLRLDQVAEALKTMPETQHITVEGHTDDVGTTEFNQQLSLSRAQVVRDYLVGRGITPTRIEAYGFGSSRPLVDNMNPENRANNRRVEIVIHGGPVS